MENIVRKGESTCSKQFLLFSHFFLPYMVLIFHFRCNLKCCLQFVSIWTSLKSSGNELIKVRQRISQFQKIHEHFYSFPHYLVSSHEYYFVRNVAFTPWKKASAQCKFKMVMKQPTLPLFNFKRLSNDILGSCHKSGSDVEQCACSARGGEGP